mmetsp:Transcript_96405/g.299745  ORF Transcript_96405/g.299745 Transcript_96405/m.299745 type:complete len:213 (+) Transcript_96405:1-639(+)
MHVPRSDKLLRAAKARGTKRHAEAQAIRSIPKLESPPMSITPRANGKRHGNLGLYTGGATGWETRSRATSSDGAKSVRYPQLAWLKAFGGLSRGLRGPCVRGGGRTAPAHAAQAHLHLALLRRLLTQLRRPPHLPVPDALVDDAPQALHRPLALDPEELHLALQLHVLRPQPLLAVPQLEVLLLQVVHALREAPQVLHAGLVPVPRAEHGAA